jgi:hypothetical protein
MHFYSLMAAAPHKLKLSARNLNPPSPIPYLPRNPTILEQFYT